MKRSTRLTRQRQAIIEELTLMKTHPSADEIYERTKKRLPRISLGTIYRNLEVLAEAGLIQKLALGTPLTRYDGNPVQHYHVRCQSCGRIDDVQQIPEASELRQLINNIAKTSDFVIVGHHLEFVGYCSGCKPAADGRNSQ